MSSVPSPLYSSVSTIAVGEAETLMDQASKHLYATMTTPKDEVLPENIPVYSASASKDADEEEDEDVYLYDQ